MTSPGFVKFRYLSVCSGIEAASAAWAPLGWRQVAFAEIDKFPSRVLAHHYPNIPNLGDFTAINVEALGPVDLLVGGTPCQSFSVAGKGLSLADARGNLTLAYAVLTHELVRLCGLRWAVWENVPGIFSKSDNPFGCFLGALVGHDRAITKPRGRAWPDAGMVDGPRGRAAWRVFDAQYFGLAQRRQRVFVVVGFGDDADPAAVLFERQGLQGNPAPRRETRQDLAPTISARTKGGGGLGTDAECDGALVAEPYTLAIRGRGESCDWREGIGALRGREQDSHENLVAHALRAGGFDASEDGTGGTPLVPICFSSKDSGLDSQSNLAPTLRAMSFDKSHANAGGQLAVVLDHWAVRRLMPIECERLQGFPDGYTAIPGASDGGRYKALGNSMAVPCMRWIGERIEASQ